MKHKLENLEEKITETLNDRYGGNWYKMPGMWVSDELDSYAHFVAEGGYDMNGEYTPTPYIFRRLSIMGIGEKKEYLYLTEIK